MGRCSPKDSPLPKGDATAAGEAEAELPRPSEPKPPPPPKTFSAPAHSNMATGMVSRPVNCISY